MRILALLFALFAATACYSITGYPQQPEMIAGPAVTNTIVTVEWAKDIDEIQRICAPLGTNKIWYACTSWDRMGFVTHCTVHALKPRDFNDEPLLKVLGHEFLHCLGATHKAN